MVKPPKIVKVGYLRMALEFVPETELGDSRGQWRQHEGRILIADHLSYQDQAETVIHELLHGCYPVFDMPALESALVEEVVVSTIAPHFAQIIRDNPALMTWMRQCLNTDKA